MMELLTLILIAVALLKIVSVTQAIGWLWSRGKDYADRLRRSPPRKESDYYDALDESGGRHFPFGVKDYRLRNYIALGGKAWGLRRVTPWIASVFQATVYRFERFAFLVGLWAVITVSVGHHALWFTSSATHNLLLYALTTIVLGTNSLLSAEAVFSYTILGGYATPFHMLLPRNGNRLLLELRVVTGKIVTTIFSGAVAAYVAYAAFAGLEGRALVTTPTASVLDTVGAFLQMVYWATTTFATVGYGDISPANGYGQLVAFLIEVQAFAVLGIVFASLFASKDTAP